MSSEPSVILIFFSALLSFFSPWIMSIIPGYLSYISGVGVNEVNTGKVRFKVMLNTVFFVLGYSFLFIIMEILSIYVLNFVSIFIENEIIFKVIGVIVIILGLNMTGIVTVNFLFKEHKIKNRIKSKNIIISFFSGFIFFIGWIPCVSSILYSVILYISKVENIEKGIMYMTVYCIGMGVLFLITGFFMDFVLKFFRKVSKFGRAIEITTGIILSLTGIMLFFNKLDVVSEVFG